MPYVGNDPNILVYIEAYDQANTAYDQANTAINQANGAVLKTGNTMTGNLVMSGANIAFTTATNSGIYWGGTGLSFIRSPAANTIVFGTSGAEDMRIDASGNVLIGTTITNSGKLSLGATVRNRVFALYDEGTNWYGLGIAGSEFKILRPNGAILTFGGYDRATDTSTELMRLDSSGNLGIGTSVPGTLFQVGNAYLSLSYNNTYAATNWFGTSGIGFNCRRTAADTWTFSTDTGNNGGGLIDGDIGGPLRFFVRSTSGGSVATLTDAQMLATERMRITGAGNVGIATKSPTATLHVSGNVTAQAIDVAGVNVAPTIVAAFAQANTANTTAVAAFAAANSSVTTGKAIAMAIVFGG